MCNSKCNKYTRFPIKEVKDWLIPNGKVELPTIQRGFVWKASQIESLWDSIFRGYPIGSMMLSLDSTKKLYLLDGQQRTTAIALGFFNPWEDKETKEIGNAKNLPVIWMDINPGAKTLSQKYVFRVVTRSHPWGYKLQNHEERLSTNDIHLAWKKIQMRYGEKTYTSLKPYQRIPYEANLPVPLSFLLEAFETNNPVQYIIDLCEKHKITSLKRYTDTEDNEQQRIRYIADLNSFLNSKDGEVLLNNIQNQVLNTIIPAIILPNHILYDTEQDDKQDDESTLFIRLNRAGTRIDGEELIYSLYKSVFPKAKTFVDSINASFIAPSRIITLVARLAYSDWKEGIYSPHVSLKKFKEWLLCDEYHYAIQKYIECKDSKSDIGLAIQNAIHILQCSNPEQTNDCVPNVVVKNFIRHSPDGFLLLLHWLLNKNDTIISFNDKRTICGRLYSLFWFGDISAFAKKYWSRVSDNKFWEIQIDNIDNFIQYPLIKGKLFHKLLMSNQADTKSTQDAINEIWKKSISFSTENTDFNNYIINSWNDFKNKVFYNRQLILLAQRYYINDAFLEFNQLEDLEDSNVPWDWDHIYPSSWVYYRKNISPKIKDWEWRIGNLRAMSLTDNRSEGNSLSPKERLQNENDRNNYFIKDDWEFWQKIENKNDSEDLIKNHNAAIITRTINIYQNFLDMFGIKGLDVQ